MEICRTCMNANRDERHQQLVPIYSKLDDAFIANIIMECTAIQIFENDGLPAQICTGCIETLKLLVAFVKTARDCDLQLRQICKSEISPDQKPSQGGCTNDVIAMENETDVFQFTEVKVEPLEGLADESVAGLEQEEIGTAFSDSDQDAAIESGDDDSQRSSGSDGSDSESDWKASDDDEVDRKVPKKRGRKAKPKMKNTDERPLLNKRRRKDEDDLAMNEYEQELYTVIEVKRGSHICCGCMLLFDSAQELETHRSKFHVRKRESTTKPTTKVLCDGCLRKYKSKRRVNYHKERMRQLKIIWECNKCKNRFSEATRRRNHSRKHPRKLGPTAVVAPIKAAIQQELGWICCAQACGLSFPSEKDMIEHAHKAHQINKQEAELEENQDRPVQCQVCYRRFHDKNGLINHQQRLYKLQKFQCALCGLQFNSGVRLSEHELTHQNDKPFKCDVCDKTFTQKGNLKTHMTIHSLEKPYQCTVCGMSFRQKGGLKAHMSNHVENPQFKCEVCSKLFKAKLHLRYHMRIHSGERPFPCRHCDKAFSDFTNRMRHEMSHTGIKPYKCSYCEKSFIRKRFLLEHESTHTGIKMYNCEVCHQSFGQKSSLKKHLQTNHPTFGAAGDWGEGSSSSSHHHHHHHQPLITIDSAPVSPTGSTNSNGSTLSIQHHHHQQQQHLMPPQTHPISLTSQQQLQLMTAFHQPH
ncbi:zinc finger protein 345-like [Ochlerotatus camptorhynchus]|uniref:zinc finger protein 345-like n=1 Tax=Ochlerotatus camptorhynchus TaxID=644619 RepID=UPI0031D34289